MIGAAINMGLNVVGGVLGAIGSARANKKVQQQLDNQRAANQSWFNRKYNENPLERADAIALINATRDAMLSSNRNAQARASVAGASEESVAAQKAASTNAMANTASNIALDGARRKEAFEQQYMAKNDAYDDRQANIYQNQGNAWLQAGALLANSGQGFLNEFDSSKKKD